MDPDSPEFRPQGQTDNAPSQRQPQPATPTVPPSTPSTVDQLTSAVQQLMQQSRQNQQQTSQLFNMINTMSTRMEEGFRHFESRADRARERVEHVHQRVQAAASYGAVLQPLPSGLKMPKLNTIDGKREQELRDWFVKVAQYLRAFGLDEADPRAVFYVSHHFTGALATWYQGVLVSSVDGSAEGFTSVSELRDAALKQFTGRDPAEVARDNLRSKRQTGTVSEWAQFVRRQLVHLPKRDDADNLHTFRAGLTSDIAKALAPQDPKTLAEAVEMAIKVEASMRRVDGRGLRSSRGAADDKVKLQLNNIEESDDSLGEDDDDAGSDVDIEESEEEEEDCNNAQGDFVERSKRDIIKLKKEGRCLKCGVKGHYARNCPKKSANPKARNALGD